MYGKMASEKKKKTLCTFSTRLCEDQSTGGEIKLFFLYNLARRDN
jgi:hypothetical protein